MLNLQEFHSISMDLIYSLWKLIPRRVSGLVQVETFRRNVSTTQCRNAIASQTKGIVFLSTPHSGSDMASWIRHIGGILRTTVSVEELEAHHSRLRELNLFYRHDKQFSQIPMLVYCETLPTHGILVVNQTSADPGGNAVPVPVDYDHISICKVGDKKSQIYRQVKRFIDKNLTTLLPPITLKPNANTHYEIELDQEQFANFPSAKNLTSANKKLVAVTSTETVEVFFSYSHRDRDLRDELAKHLKLLERQGVITSWHDRQIGAGREWQGEINQHLNTSRVILLLVSANSLASEPVPTPDQP
ncbi:MAG TPA: toll/interleukin-1 receptor domain-containing protein [Oculatellaceae cyanobacterium]